MNKDTEPKTKTKLGKPVAGTQADIDLVNRAQDGDTDALLKIMNSDTVFVIEQSEKGKTIADKGAKATIIPIIDEED